jgi:hypothetical protein
VDSRAITKLIRKRVWPALGEHGFTTFTTRSAWRYWEEGIDVVNFQALGSYSAGVIGCTPFSFAVNLGISVDYLPRSPVNERGGRPAPEEYECILRTSLSPSIPQQRYDVGPTDVWYVDGRGRNAEANVQDAVRVLVGTGLPWFESYRDPGRVLADLRAGKLEDCAGADPSPLRHYLIGYTALRTGDAAVARDHFRALLATGIPVGGEGEIEAVVARLA